VTGSREPTATVSVRVDVPPDRAFALFVHEIDQWWRRGPKYRHAGAGPGVLRLEPRLDGVVEEVIGRPGCEQRFELGRVTAFEPAVRLAFTWRNATFAPFEQTEVEVVFTAMQRSTLVTVRHRGWEALRTDHPARHGRDDTAMRREVGLWWGELLTALREHAHAGA
jgi:uncharacterized protein YndB with AHSA1/START domain